MVSAAAPDPEPPAHWEADVIVADGGTVHLRPVVPADADQLVALHARLSERTRYLRYFSAYPRIPERDLYRFTHVDHHDRVALLVELGGAAIAVGRYERESGTDPAPSAEVAFVVDDSHQGRGIGSVLLEHLAAAARERGIARFQAVVLAENSAMMRVFRDAGYEVTRSLEHGEVSLEFAIDETALTERVMREREQHAEARSIQRLLFPRSVAVVGASNDTGKIGSAVFGNLLRMSFDGPLYPVNAEAPHVGGVRAYPSVLDVPDEIDLVVIAVPAASVPGVVQQCAERGVRGLVVISGGFGESGDEAERAAGGEAQRQLVAQARSNGMRVIGPNCLGIVNTADSVRLNASLAPLPPLTGRAGFFCQSGALGVAVLGEAARRGLGVSTFVSAGNRADVSGNDLLQYWESDTSTDVVLMYLESFGNPRKFARLTRRLGRSKPIVAVNSGAGASVVPGLAHTSVEISEASVRALFEASGIIRVDTVGELFDVALLLTSQPLPPAPDSSSTATSRLSAVPPAASTVPPLGRVAVVGNSTALGVLVANACAAEGLTVAWMDDVGVDSGPLAFETALRAAVDDRDVDAVVVVFMPPLQRASTDEVAVALRTVAATSAKPVLSTFLGFEGIPDALRVAGGTAPPRGSVPSYPSPERAVRALARATRYAAWRRQPAGTVPELDGLDPAAAHELVDAVLRAEPAGRDLDAVQAEQLLRCFGIAMTEHADGVYVLLGVHEDPSFGAVVSFGLGGVATELFDDRAYATVPLTTADAQQLIRAPRAAPLLRGYEPTAPTDRPRGGSPRTGALRESTEPVAQDALVELALRVSALGDALPEIAECTLQVAAASDGAHVVSALVRVAPSTARGDTGPRRLRGL